MSRRNACIWSIWRRSGIWKTWSARPLDPLRFRANVYFDGAEPWAEKNWPGRQLRVGGARLKVFTETDRCEATNVNPETAERDTAIPPTLLRAYGTYRRGIYATVTEWRRAQARRPDRASGMSSAKAGSAPARIGQTPRPSICRHPAASIALPLPLPASALAARLVPFAAAPRGMAAAAGAAGVGARRQQRSSSRRILLRALGNHRLRALAGGDRRATAASSSAGLHASTRLDGSAAAPDAVGIRGCG